MRIKNAGDNGHKEKQNQRRMLLLKLKQLKKQRSHLVQQNYFQATSLRFSQHEKSMPSFINSFIFMIRHLQLDAMLICYIRICYIIIVSNCSHIMTLIDDPIPFYRKTFSSDSEEEILKENPKKRTKKLKRSGYVL